MVRFAAMVCVLGLLAGPAAAASLTPSLNTLHAARDYQLRDGDFDGDGRLDDLYLVAEDSGRVAVRVRLSATGADVRITSVDAPANTPPSLQVVAAGTFQNDCGDYADGCTGAIVTASDSLVLTLDSGINVLMHWRDGRFEQDFVRRDEAMMARALVGLLARNP
jgi:hypothetical protein